MEPQGLSGAFRAPSLEEERDRLTPQIKDLRKQIDSLIQIVTNANHTNDRTGKEIRVNDFKTRNIQGEVEKKLIEAKMWAGKMLESLGSPFPKELADKAE